MITGTRVIVLVDGVYSKPDRKANPPARAGDVIEVMGGWYVKELIEGGLVDRFDAASFSDADLEDVDDGLEEEAASDEEQDDRGEEESAESLTNFPGLEPSLELDPEPEAEPEAEPEPGERPWAILMPYTPHEKAAQVLWNAGIRSKDDVLAAVAAGGMKALTALQYVGDKTARDLIAWAEGE